MSITANEGGVLHELTEITTNEGGVLYNLDTVHANDGGILQEIHSGLPTSLTWTCDTSKDSTAKLNSVSADGLTVNYTIQNPSWATAYDAIFSNYVYLPAGTVISTVFSNISGVGSSNHCGMHIEKSPAEIVGGGQASSGGYNSFTFNEAGTYRFVLRGHSVTGSQTGVKYYPCTATVQITFQKQ